MINKLFNEDTIGFSVIGMLFIACLYLYTESTTIQKVGLLYGLFVFILMIGLIIKTILQAIKDLYRLIKNKQNK